MRIIYRLCGVASTNPSPIYNANKEELNRFCLQSFVKGVQDIEPEIHFLMDYCGNEYDGMLDTYVPWIHIKEHTELGINGTMLRAYELASQANDVVLLQECDYVWQPNSGKLLEQAIKELGMVSPYDHRNFYLDRNLHSKTCEIELVGEHHFRSTERNTMTWGCHSKLIKDNYDLFTKYGYLDSDIWYELKKRGVTLFVPIPALATHMAEGWLAPGVNWRKQWSNIASS